MNSKSMERVQTLNLRVPESVLIQQRSIMSQARSRQNSVGRSQPQSPKNKTESFQKQGLRGANCDETRQDIFENINEFERRVKHSRPATNLLSYNN